MVAKNAKVVVEGQLHVTIPPTTHATLCWLGWTPPDGSAVEL